MCLIHSQIKKEKDIYNSTKWNKIYCKQAKLKFSKCVYYVYKQSHSYSSFLKHLYGHNLECLKVM